MAQATAPADIRKNGRSPRQRMKQILSYAALILLTLAFVAPLLWMLSTSFKSNFESTQWPLTWIPREFTTQAYSEIFTTSQTPVIRWFLNSLLAAAAHTAFVLLTAAPAAYALGRMHFRGKRIMWAIIISTLFIPHIILIIPNYLIVDMFGWLDTLLAVIVPSVPTALYLFLLRQFFISLPKEL